MLGPPRIPWRGCKSTLGDGAAAASAPFNIPPNSANSNAIGRKAMDRPNCSAQWFRIYVSRNGHHPWYRDRDLDANQYIARRLIAR